MLSHEKIHPLKIGPLTNEIKGADTINFVNKNLKEFKSRFSILVNGLHLGQMHIEKPVPFVFCTGFSPIQLPVYPFRRALFSISAASFGLLLERIAETTAIPSIPVWLNC